MVEKQYLKNYWLRIFQIFKRKNPASFNQKYPREEIKKVTPRLMQ